MRAVDVGIHGRKPVGEGLRHEALSREVVAFIKRMLAEDAENRRLALKTGRM